MICIKLVNIKNNNFEHVLYLLHIETKEKKIIIKKIDSSKKTTVKLSRKIDLKGGYTEEYIRFIYKINTIYNTNMLY